MTYAADVVNQYTAVGGVARTHDNNGNLKDDGTYVFSYDFQNRLVQVRQSGTLTLIADYHYDALRRRVEKVLAAGTTTRYLLDGVEVVEEYDAVGNWQARYVYEDGIDRPRCMDRADIADVNGNQNTTEVLRFHYHQQALGSVTEVTQPTGAVVEWVTYDVYGQPTIRDQQGNVITQSAIGNPYLYTGREYDSEDSLYHFRARAYDPAAARFLQRDRQGYVDGLNLYSYARCSPTTRVDPLGNKSGLKKLWNALKTKVARVRSALFPLATNINNIVARIRRHATHASVQCGVGGGLAILGGLLSGPAGWAVLVAGLLTAAQATINGYAQLDDDIAELEQAKREYLDAFNKLVPRLLAMLDEMVDEYNEEHGTQITWTINVTNAATGETTAVPVGYGVEHEPPASSGSDTGSPVGVGGGR